MQRYHFNTINTTSEQDIATSEGYTQEIVTNFESQHGNKAWFAVSKPQRLDFVHGPEYENWNEAVLDTLETMLERIIKPLGVDKMRMYMETRTAQGQFGFNLDFWYEKEEKKPQQQSQPTTQEIINTETNIQPQQVVKADQVVKASTVTTQNTNHTQKPSLTTKYNNNQYFKGGR